jgi:glycosyltransferase involved in cell wall biosynthesis
VPRPKSAARSRCDLRILFINQYYWPDHASTAQHLADLAESLAAAGYACTVLCSRGSYKPGQPARPARETHQGVQIRRVAATSFGRRNGVGRMADYLSFYVRAFIQALLLPRFDLVVTLTTPPLIGLVGSILRRRKGARHVVWSMDLHPDASCALGRMSPRNPLVSLLDWLSGTVLRQADKIVALGPYMADRIATKRIRPSRLVTIPVWSRSDEVYPLPRERHPLRARLGLDGKFVVMYSGNLGLAHSFGEVMEAARRLRERSDIVFLFVGGGPRLAEVLDAKRRDQLDNVRHVDYVPRGQLAESLSVADVHLITMRPEMTGIVVPGKLYGALASGRPTIFMGPPHCESADAIRESDCGLTIGPGDAGALVAAIERLAAEPELAQALGERGRAAFLDGFERDFCCARWRGVVDEVAGVELADMLTRAADRPLMHSSPRGDD